MSELHQVGSRLGFEVLRPGFLTTVQDRGRAGYQRFGVPVSGAVDQIALRVGSVLVGNPQAAGALEIALQGPKLRLLEDAVLALTGAEFAATLDEEPVPWYESFAAHRGQVLDIQGVLRGLRAYLSVAGGIDVPVILRSRSTCLVAHFGGFHGRALQPGDMLPIGRPARALEGLTGWAAPEKWRWNDGSPVMLRVVWGPQDDAFTEEGRGTFLESTYQVTPHADRMGCRLDGPRIAHRLSADILSDWIPPGGIQVPGDGRPIILLVDRQTTGGYAKIATVIGPDISLVAQARPGDALRFQAIGLTEAQGAVRNLEAGMAELPAHLIDTSAWGGPAAMGEVPGAVRTLFEKPAGESANANTP
jgi:antagonist of KipI